MTYRDFNKKIFELYLARSSSAFAIFSFDKFELESIMPLTEIKRLEILRSDWPYLLREIDNIPQYFGLLAVQCCAAAMMETSDEVTHNAYQLRLVRLLGLKDEAELQQLFKQEAFGRPVQEVLWSKAKSFLKECLNQQLSIPAATSNAGRYVQYPKFQSLFNTEELKYFTLFFHQTFQVKENIAFSFFESKFRSTVSLMDLSPRMRELLSDSRKESLCIKQLYNYYNRWNGELYELKKKKDSQPAGEPAYKEQSKLILIVKNNACNFYLAPTYAEISLAESLSIGNYHYFYKTVQLFSEMPGYYDEYEHSRFIYKDVPCCVLVNKNLSNNLFSYLLNDNNGQLLTADQGFALFRYLPSEQTITSPLSRYMQSVRPVSLRGGLRIKQKDYLIGFGPAILTNNDHVVLFGNAPYSYDAQTAGAGAYAVRTADFRDLNFNIVAPGPAVRVIAPKAIGWDLRLLAPSAKPNLEGCLYDAEESIKTQPIRSWVNLQNAGSRDRKYKTTNPLFMAINNAKL